MLQLGRVDPAVLPTVRAAALQAVSARDITIETGRRRACLDDAGDGSGVDGSLANHMARCHTGSESLDAG